LTVVGLPSYRSNALKLTGPLSAHTTPVKPRMQTSIEIPVRNSDQVVEISLVDLPETPEPIMEVLLGEQVERAVYCRIAKAYYMRGAEQVAQDILERALELPYEARDNAVEVINMLAGLCIRRAVNSADKSVLDEATLKYNESDRVDIHDDRTWVGKGLLLLLRKDRELALYQFTNMLEKKVQVRGGEFDGRRITLERCWGRRTCSCRIGSTRARWGSLCVCCG
jgi:tetratricopeptide (TPR) repeat protein